MGVSIDRTVDKRGMIDNRKYAFLRKEKSFVFTMVGLRLCEKVFRGTQDKIFENH